MLHQSGLEAAYVTTYVEDYLDAMDALPSQVQPHLSEVCRLDIECRAILIRLDEIKDQLIAERESMSAEMRAGLLDEVKQLLYQGQLNGDQKIAQINSVTEVVAEKCQQLDHDVASLEPSSSQDGMTTTSARSTTTGSQRRLTIGGVRNSGRSVSNQSLATNAAGKRSSFDRTISTISGDSSHRSGTPSGDYRVGTGNRAKRPRVQKQFADFVELPNDLPPATAAATNRRDSKKDDVHDRSTTNNHMTAGGRKRTESSTKAAAVNVKNSKPARRAKKTSRASAATSSVDPDEPTYCLCDQVSFGEMIGCDYSGCALEWFHFECVDLKTKPKGKWYCPSCRGDRVNSLKPSLLKNGK